MREVIVWPSVHNTLWQNLSKEAYDNVCRRLLDQLEKEYDRWRKRRHPDDETLFVYTLYLALGENWHTLEFLVDDTMADTHLFVIDVIHHLGKTRIE